MARSRRAGWSVLTVLRAADRERGRHTLKRPCLRALA